MPKFPAKKRAQIPARPTRFEPLETRTLFAATVIDVMVVYDADAKTFLGNISDSAIQKLIRQSIDSANQVHYNTNDNVVLRLVHTEQIAYSNDNGDIGTDLNRLQGTNDGFMDGVHALRNTYGADLVSLISTPSFRGGLANLLVDPNAFNRQTEAFSVISADAIGPGSFVMAHEMGHNMGAGHERDNNVDPTPDVAYPYAFGYHFTGNNGVEYGDIMSYQGLTLPYFSTPTISYQGQPIGKPAGDPNAADLKSVFLQTAPIVAAYRASVATDTTAPAATLYQADLSGNLLTFTVRYQDDISVNASTLDGGDVSVQTPEGFKLAAELLSLDRTGDGYAKLATYRVTLPDSKPPLASLQFLLNANQVKDVNNNITPAGAIAPNTDFDIDTFSFQAARDTGTLIPPTTRQLAGNISIDDNFDFYKFTVTQQSAFTATLSGLSAQAEIFLMQDLNGDDVFSGGSEQITGTNAATTADRSFAKVLPAGTYYILVQLTKGQPPTNYSLTVRNYTDTVAPTAKIDTIDATTTSNAYNFSVIYGDDQDLDAASIRQNALVAFNGGGFFGTTGSPKSTTVLSSGQIEATYAVPVGSNLSNGVVTLTVASTAAVKDAAGNLLPIGTTIGTYRIAVGQADTTAPTRTIAAAPPVLVPTGTTYDFTIAYQDNRGLPTTTLDGSDITVTGPAGFSQPAQFISSTPSLGGAFRYATYRITPPGGAWDYHDDGTYTITLNAAQVKDAANNSAASGAVGTFTVHVPYQGDANADDKTDFLDLALLAQSYNTPGGKGVANGDFNFDGAVDFLDLALLAQTYNTSFTGAAPVPSASFSEALAAAFAGAPEPAPTTTVAPTHPAKPSKPTKPTKPAPPTRPVAPPPFSTVRLARKRDTLFA
ncbi:MAG: conserved repeat domain protein [Phycisphaerales bacterium]|nr:conserved repeat domain protein [Phycisphaerales bacterium]